MDTSPGATVILVDPAHPPSRKAPLVWAIRAGIPFSVLVLAQLVWIAWDTQMMWLHGLVAALTGLGIVAFVVIIIGGIGSVKGAFVGAMIVGLIDTMGRAYLDSLMKLVMSIRHAETAAPAVSAMMIYIIMAVVLAVRPQGLFPPRGR